jgi:hypothetical protein
MQSLGVLQAVARRLFAAQDRGLSPSDVQHVQEIAIAVIVLSVAAAMWTSWRLSRLKSVAPEARLGLTYAAFFALMPILSLATHPHTFIFLLPVVVVITAEVIQGSQPFASRVLLALWFSVCYAMTGAPIALITFDRFFGTSLAATWLTGEPIIGNALVVAGLVGYVEYLVQRDHAFGGLPLVPAEAHI